MAETTTINVSIIQVPTGFCLKLDLEDGGTLWSENTFKTKEEANAAIKQWCESMGGTHIPIS